MFKYAHEMSLPLGALDEIVAQRRCSHNVGRWEIDTILFFVPAGLNVPLTVSQAGLQ